MASWWITQVGDYVERRLPQWAPTPSFQRLLWQLLARPGRLFSTEVRTKWPAFVLTPCEALSGDPRAGVRAAAAVELAITAGDVFDDVADGDETDLPGGKARALNAGVALLCASHQCIADLRQHIEAQRVIAVSGLMAAGIARACQGQDLDLEMEGRIDVSEEASYRATDLKSGSLVSMACQVGVAVATDQTNLIEGVGELGRHIGIVAQLLNDIAGISEGGSDLSRRKKTLPVAYALRCAKEEHIPPLIAWYNRGCEPLDLSEERMAKMLNDLGALHYAYVVADAHRRQAERTLESLVRDSGCQALLELGRLIPVVRARDG